MLRYIGVFVVAMAALGFEAAAQDIAVPVRPGAPAAFPFDVSNTGEVVPLGVRVDAAPLNDDGRVRVTVLE